MQIHLRCTGEPTHTAPAELLGHNLELAADTATGVLSERLSNPHFGSPAHPQTGIAAGWQPFPNNNYAGGRFDLVQGLYYSGRESQLILNYSGREYGVLQTQRWLRAGETLEVEIWARTDHHPVTLTVGVRPCAGPASPYATAQIRVEAPYWAPYRATLTATQDDDDAVFFITFAEEGVVYLDQAHLRPAGVGAVRPDLLAGMRSLQIPVLRFPGGCVSTGYHWELGVGPAAKRAILPDPVFKWEINYLFGTDEYLALCQELGIRPQISVNISTATPEEAAAWAAYCAAWFRARGSEPPLMYWQMGNEQYGHWEIGNMSGATYAETLRAFVPGIRAAYPAARIIALGPAHGSSLRPGDNAPWRAAVLDGAADLIDVLALQHYTWGVNPDLTAQVHATFAGVSNLAAAVREALADCTARNLPITLAVTEFNLWHQASHYDDKGFLETYDVEHGLFVAGVLQQFARLAPGLELANFYNLVNPMGIYLSRGAVIDETCLAGIFRLYRPAFPGAVLPLASDAPMLADGMPVVDALALRTADATWLFVLNTQMTDSATIALEGLPAPTGGLTLCGTDPLGDFTVQPADVRDGVVVVPPLSVTRLHLGGTSC